MSALDSDPFAEVEFRQRGDIDMPMNGTPILLCKNFAYVTGAAGSIAFDWRGFDSSYQNATFRIECKLYDTGTINLVVETTTDMGVVSSLGSTNVTAVGITNTAITSGLLQNVRLVISSAAAAGGTLSVWLLPKHD